MARFHQLGNYTCFISFLDCAYTFTAALIVNNSTEKVWMRMNHDLLTLTIMAIVLSQPGNIGIDNIVFLIILTLRIVYATILVLDWGYIKPM